MITSLLILYIAPLIYFFTKFAKDEPTFYDSMFTSITWPYKLCILTILPLVIFIYLLLHFFI